MIDTVHTQNLTEYLQQRLEQYLDMLRKMVAVNTFTSNSDGVCTLADMTADAFAKLEFRAEKVRSLSPFYGDHMILRRNSKFGQSAPTIALVSHLDTVFPADEERRNDFSWRIEGDKIFGPGVVDIKGGTIVIYMMLDALRAIHPDEYEQVNWIILLNAAEEVLVPDFGELCRERIPSDALACLVFEGGPYHDNWFSVVNSRKGMMHFRVEVEGKAAHAGVAHQSGANAIVQLGYTLTSIEKLTNYERGITFNVGSIAGGTVVNRVPHMAVASGEARSFSTAVLDEGIERLLALEDESQVATMDGKYSCVVKIQVLNKWKPWPPNQGSEELINVWRKAGSVIGAEIEPRPRGGLSDGNFLWDHVPTIDGLGPAGGNAHCSERSSDGSKEQEYVLPGSFVPKALLNILGVLSLIRMNSRTHKENLENGQ